MNKRFEWILHPGKYMGNEHMKIREMHMKAPGRYQFMVIRISKIKETDYIGGGREN